MKGPMTPGEVRQAAKHYQGVFKWGAIIALAVVVLLYVVDAMETNAASSSHTQETNDE